MTCSRKIIFQPANQKCAGHHSSEANSYHHDSHKKLEYKIIDFKAVTFRSKSLDRVLVLNLKY